MELVMNFTTPHSSANITVSSLWQIGILEIWMFSFSFMTGLPTHTYVIWLIVTGTGSGVASEFFNLNLSVCEIFFSVNSLLNVATKWSSFQILTALTQFLFGFSLTGRPLFQSLICVERYLAVVHPVTFLKSKPLRYRLICCTVVWILTLGSCFCSMFTMSFSTHVYIWFYSLQFLLFLFIQLFCLVAVLRALKQSGPGERRREEENHMKRRAFLIIKVTNASLVVTYVPFIVTGLFSIASDQIIQILWSVSYICFLLAGFVQPGLYLHRNGKLLLLHLCKKM